MATTNDPIRQIFLAGIGALAMGAEKSQQIIDQLVQKGQITVDEGKDMSHDIAAHAEENFDKVRDDIIKSHMKTMTKEQREEFAAHVVTMASQIDANDELASEEAKEVSTAASADDAK